MGRLGSDRRACATGGDTSGAPRICREFPQQPGGYRHGLRRPILAHHVQCPLPILENVVVRTAKWLVGGSGVFYLMLTLPPPARNSPARVAKPMTLGPIFRTIAAMHVLRWV